MTKNDKSILVDDDDDAVGYGKPPKHTRFQKGQSGNPRGRKPQSEYLNWQHPVFDVLLEDVAIPIRGKPTELPGIVWMLRSMRNQAIKGCYKSFKVLIDAAGGDTKTLWYNLRERKRERTLQEIQREVEEARRFVEEELPKWGKKQ